MWTDANGPDKYDELKDIRNQDWILNQARQVPADHTCGGRDDDPIKGGADGVIRRDLEAIMINGRPQVGSVGMVNCSLEGTALNGVYNRPVKHHGD